MNCCTGGNAAKESFFALLVRLRVEQAIMGNMRGPVTGTRAWDRSELSPAQTQSNSGLTHTFLI